MVANNKELRPGLTPMHDNELIFDSLDIHGKGHGWALAMSSRARFARRTSLTEHTRLVPFHFSIPGAKANKVYAYHVMALSAAYLSIMEPAAFPDLPYSLEDVFSIEADKRADSPTVLHNCGNAFCCNPCHYIIAAKTFNDVQEFCHHFMRMTATKDALINLRDNVCALYHSPKPLGSGNCWTNVYNLADLDAKRVTFSSLTHEEIAELATGENVAE